MRPTGERGRVRPSWRRRAGQDGTVRMIWRATVAAVVASTAMATVALPAQATRRVTPPPVHARVDYQLGGGYPPPAGVTVVTRDMTERPARGTYGICYVNAFQTQGDAAHWWLTRHRALVLRTAKGTPIQWPAPSWSTSKSMPPICQLCPSTKTVTPAGILKRIFGWRSGPDAVTSKAILPDTKPPAISDSKAICLPSRRNSKAGERSMCCTVFSNSLSVPLPARVPPATSAARESTCSVPSCR